MLASATRAVVANGAKLRVSGRFQMSQRLLMGARFELAGAVRHTSVRTSPSSAPSRTQYDLPNSAVDAYERDGVVILRGLLSADEVAILREAIDWNQAHPGPLAGVASADTDPGRFFEDFCNWSRVRGYERLAFESALPSVSARLMHSKSVRLYHDHLLVKEARTKQPTPWHQDQPYYNISGRQNVSFWMPVDPIPRESTLEFLRASHDGTWYMPRTFLTEQAKWFAEGSFADVPDVAKGGYDVLGWDLQPGDAVAFHMLTVHGSAGTTARRRAFSLRFIGDDVRHAPRPWRTSPQFDGLADELAEGAEMEHPLFPLVWRGDSE